MPKTVYAICYLRLFTLQRILPIVYFVCYPCLYFLKILLLVGRKNYVIFTGFEYDFVLKI